MTNGGNKKKQWEQMQQTQKEEQKRDENIEFVTETETVIKRLLISKARISLWCTAVEAPVIPSEVTTRWKI